MPKIEVTFDIDANGILDAAARDTATGRTQSIRVSGSTRLSEQEKKRMVGDAERYAEEDKKRRAAAEQLNEADALCYQADKMLAEFSDRLTAEVKKQIEDARRETREALAKKDVELTAQRIGKLKKAIEQGGAIIYTQTPGAYRAQRGPSLDRAVGVGCRLAPDGCNDRYLLWFIICTGRTRWLTWINIGRAAQVILIYMVAEAAWTAQTPVSIRSPPGRGKSWRAPGEFDQVVSLRRRDDRQGHRPDPAPSQRSDDP